MVSLGCPKQSERTEPLLQATESLWLFAMLISQGLDPRKDRCMAQRDRVGADVKQMPLRLDRALYQELSRRSTINRK